MPKKQQARVEPKEAKEVVIDKKLVTKYRPDRLDDVVGQDTVVKKLGTFIRDRSAQCFLFTGPSGVGKTTLARIAAYDFGCSPGTIREIDAATNTGVDNMRDVQELLQYKSLGDEADGRAIIVDECFAKGTLVETPAGAKPIDTLRPGDKIFGVTGIQTVKNTWTKLVPLARIVLLRSETDPIIVSEEHPFLTWRGWIEAEKLNGEKLIRKDDIIPMHLQEMWDDIYKHRIRGILLQNMLDERMRNLWKSIHIGTKQKYNHLLTSLLQYISRFETYWTPFGGKKGQFAFSYAKQSITQSKTLSKIGQSRFEKDDSKQPDAFANKHKSDDRNQKKQRNPSCLEGAKRREWQRPYKTSSIVTLFSWRYIGICRYYTKTIKARWLAILLQSRYWVSREKTCYRNQFRPPWTSQKNSPIKKRSASTRVRVERAKLSELTNIGQSKINPKTSEHCFEFHDLEIQEHPSFRVEGLTVHNCHMLSKGAWNSILKATEEPPPHVFWFFCTTEAGKVPQTIKTRAVQLDLKLLTEKELGEIYDFVSKEEGIDLEGDIGDLIIREAGGSARQLLINIASCRDAENKREAAELLRSAIESEAVIAFCRFLVQKQQGSWRAAMEVLEGLKSEAPESVRIVVCNYMAACLLNAKSEGDAKFFLQILEHFSRPFNASEGMAPLYLSLGYVLYRM